jgi:hypothetical protein
MAIFVVFEMAQPRLPTMPSHGRHDQAYGGEGLAMASQSHKGGRIPAMRIAEDQ